MFVRHLSFGIGIFGKKKPAKSQELDLKFVNKDLGRNDLYTLVVLQLQEMVITGHDKIGSECVNENETRYLLN